MSFVVDAPEDIFTEEQLVAAEIEEYQRARLTKVTLEGETVIDRDALKEKTFQIVTSKLVNNRTEMGNKNKTLTQGELQGAVFPGSPGADPTRSLAELTPLQLAIKSRLRRAIWNLTNPSRKGYIQNRLGKEGRTEVLVRTEVQRGVDDIVSVFITNDAELIMQKSVSPVVEKLLSAAREVRLYNEMIIESRHPELLPDVAKMLATARKRVAAELTGPNGTAPALPASSSERTDTSVD